MVESIAAIVTVNNSSTNGKSGMKAFHVSLSV